MHRVEETKAARGNQRLAAAAAAVADEIHPLLHIFAKLHQAVFVGLVEQIQAFGGVDAAGIVVAGE